MGRPDGFGSSDFAQIVDFVMLYRSVWASEADSKRNMEFLAEEGLWKLGLCPKCRFVMLYRSIMVSGADITENIDL